MKSLGTPHWSPYASPSSHPVDGRSEYYKKRIRPMALKSLQDPALNKDTAYTHEERISLGLRGLLPPAVLSLQQQVTLELEHICSKADPLEQYIGLIALLDRNEILFYRLLVENPEKFIPVVYTPTVGLAAQKFSHIFRRPRGLYLTPLDRGHLVDCLMNVHWQDIRLIVVTDNERILGLGDQGMGGMVIPVGKLILYTVGAGIHPSHCLPVSLDVGTDNKELLADPYYLGYRQPRLRGPAYDSFVEEFVEAVCKVFPRALLQWEDFKKGTAFRLLDRYRDALPSFNDDIQGTAAVVLGGIYAGLRLTAESLKTQRALYLGAGAAGVGIGRLVRLAMIQAGLNPSQALLQQMHFDSKGVVCEGQPNMDVHKRDFAWKKSDLESLGIKSGCTLAEAIRCFRPTILIGTTGEPGVFSEEVIREMSRGCKQPMIFPLSNPSSKTECTPTQAILHSEGRALVATGSPFEAVRHNGRTREIGQCNNVFIFPGVGLGILISGAKRVTETMFLAAAKELGDFTSDQRLGLGALYPRIQDLREVSRKIGFKVAKVAREEGVGRELSDNATKYLIEKSCWYPDYVPHGR